MHLQWRSLGTARDRVRLESQDGALAHGWLTVTPSRALGTTLPDSDFRSLCRYLLGLPLTQDGAAAKCPACGDACDPLGDHSVNCGKNGITRRHNAVRDEWSRTLSAASIPHAKEVVATGLKRPADILLIGWHRGRDVCVDFTICNPIAADNFPLKPGMGKQHLSLAEREKIRKEGPLCAQAAWGFHPAALSPWSCMGPAAKWLLHDTLKKITPDLTLAAHSARIQEIKQNISITLAREVARQLK